LEPIPFVPSSPNPYTFDAVYTLGTAVGSIPTGLTLTGSIASISDLNILDDVSDKSVLLVDYQFLQQEVDPSHDLNTLSADLVNTFSQDLHCQLRSLTTICAKYASVTYLRILPSTTSCSPSSSLAQSLATGALRSFQSEHNNLRVSAISISNNCSHNEFSSILEKLLSSPFLPSDLYADDCGQLLARNTRSHRLGLQSKQDSFTQSQWKTVFVFGGASALSLECLQAVIDNTTELYLFGRRAYDQIFDSIPELRDCADLNKYILEHEPSYSSSIKDLRSRTRYLSAQIELAETIESLAKLCKKVHYYSCDITDSSAMASVMSTLSNEYNVLPTSIVFAAGLLRDSLLSNMSEEDFSDVISVKCTGLLNVFNYVPLETCQSLYVFGSVSGTFGNKGQTNYSAANEGIYRIAKLFSQNHPDLKTILFSWGPWSEVGMALPEVNAQFQRRGISPLTNQQGVDCFQYASQLQTPGFYAPVCGFAPWNDLEATFNTGLSPDLGSIYLQRDNLTTEGSAIREFATTQLSEGFPRNYQFDLKLIPLFLDHILSAQFVVPFAFILECYLDIALELSDSPHLAISNLRCLKGLQVPTENTNLEFTLIISDPDHEGQRSASVHLTDSTLPSYSGQLGPLKSFSVPSPRTSAETNLVDSHLPSANELYRDYLFHGRCFQVIQALRSATSSSIKATVCLSGVPNDLAVLSGKYWICPPPLYDAVAQLALIWRRLFDNQTALPSSLNGLIVHDYTKLTGLLDVNLINIESSDLDMTFDALIYGPDNELLLSVTGMTCTCSESLNRLNKEWLETVALPDLAESSIL